MNLDEMIKVGMADLKVGKSPDVLTTLGLGSCVELLYMIQLLRLVDFALYAARQYTV